VYSYSGCHSVAQSAKAKQPHYLIGDPQLADEIRSFTRECGSETDFKTEHRGRVGKAHPTHLRRRGVRTDGAIHRPEATPPQIPMQAVE
jgi:hypothetical protein